MNLLKSILFITVMGMLILASIGCEEELSTLDMAYTQHNDADLSFEFLSEKSGTHRERPGGMKIPEGGNSAPYPTIFHQTFIPELENFADFKCLVWKITWPVYAVSMDPGWIPNYFALENGALKSLKFLQNTDPINKQKLSFSLYHNNKLASTFNDENLWGLLEAPTSKAVYFSKKEITLESLENWVTGRPRQFQNHWEYYDNDSGFEEDYNEGDFFLFHIPEDDLFGGIRIVSMSPREIEVYLAVPNTEHQSPIIGSQLFK